MFKVRHKETGEIRTVYGNSGPLFIFYYQGGWVFESMVYYEPVED